MNVTGFSGFPYENGVIQTSQIDVVDAFKQRCQPQINWWGNLFIEMKAYLLAVYIRF